jgi:hypothetical protein
MSTKGKAAKERRSALRQRSFLQGRIYYNSRRSSVDCLVRDISDTGAKLKFSESITVPEAMELYIPNKDEFRRARVQWRVGNDMGIAFGDDVETAAAGPSPEFDVTARIKKLESEIASLKRLVNDVRTELRKQQGEVA